MVLGKRGKHPKRETWIWGNPALPPHAGAEVDLDLENPSGETIALEIKRTLSPKLTPGFVESMRTLQATKECFIVPQDETFPLSESVTAISLPDYLAQLP